MHKSKSRIRLTDDFEVDKVENADATHPPPPADEPKLGEARPQSSASQQSAAVYEQQQESAFDYKTAFHRSQKHLRDAEQTLNQQRIKIGTLTSDLKNAEKDASSSQSEGVTLRVQISALKDSIAGLTRTEGQITDEELRNDLHKLAGDIQNWTVKTIRKGKLRR